LAVKHAGPTTNRGAFEMLVDGRVVNRLRRGDYFGELALLYNHLRTATMLAGEAGRVFVLDRVCPFV
jgi:CRP-like cAMP-binding protein